jgi:hypothetical protein
MIWSDIFEYKEGKLFWKINSGPNMVKGKMAGTSITTSGYHRLKYKGKKYLNHRIIFEMHNSYLPDIIDHIDQNKLNNNIDNLRAANRSLNMLNRKYSKKSKLPKGIHYTNNRYLVQLCGKYLGSYKYLESAIEVRNQSEELKFKEVLNTIANGKD